MKDYSGPAFPRPYSVHVDGQRVWEQDGMSLRDWYAGKALQGELASQNAETGEWPEGHEFVLAKQCFALADAMIAEGKDDPA